MINESSQKKSKVDPTRAAKNKSNWKPINWNGARPEAVGKKAGRRMEIREDTTMPIYNKTALTPKHSHAKYKHTADPKQKQNHQDKRDTNG